MESPTCYNNLRRRSPTLKEDPPPYADYAHFSAENNKTTMMKSAILAATAIAGCSAFAPAQTGKATTALNAVSRPKILRDRFFEPDTHPMFSDECISICGLPGWLRTHANKQSTNECDGA